MFQTNHFLSLVQRPNRIQACSNLSISFPTSPRSLYFLSTSKSILFNSINRIQQVHTAPIMNNKLSKEEVARYSRQMFCPEIGMKGQLRLKSGSVLIVGAGGLGCPSSIYLTAAGIGRLGFVDNDCVETSNLHRQILHSEGTLGKPKVDSAVDRLKQLNSNVVFEKHQVRLTRDNAMEILKNYDVIIDGTDNPMARYLLSDVCVLLNKPLVSGSALRFEGQVTVYNFNKDTPCYRCLFPQPPPAGTVTNCADGGVIGVVPGIIGNLQALEAIKIISGIPPSYAGVLLLYDGLTGKFRNVELRKRNAECVSCGDNPTVTKELMDYDELCGVKCASTVPVKILLPEERITVQQYSDILKSNQPHLLIDVRPQIQQDIVKLENAITITLAEIVKGSGKDQIKDLVDEKLKSASEKKIYVMCRRGFASQKAVRELKNHFGENSDLEFKDIIGGIQAWGKEIDTELPLY